MEELTGCRDHNVQECTNGEVFKKERLWKVNRIRRGDRMGFTVSRYVQQPRKKEG